MRFPQQDYATGPARKSSQHRRIKLNFQIVKRSDAVENPLGTALRSDMGGEAIEDFLRHRPRFPGTDDVELLHPYGEF